MPGRFEGLNDKEVEAIPRYAKKLRKAMPTAMLCKSRGMPHTPFRYVLNTLLYILITGCRWCDVPQKKQWASKSSATNSVRPMLSAWTNRRFVLVKTLARAGARRQRSCRSNFVARRNV